MRRMGLLMLLPLIACSAGNAETGEAAEARGAGPSRTFDVTGFTAVELAGVDDVDVRVGPAFSVRAQGPSEVLDRLEIRRDGDTLKVGRKRRSGWKWSEKPGGVTVFVTMPHIAGASVAGTGNLQVDRVEGRRFAGAVAGTGDLLVRVLKVDEADLSIAGTGDLVAAGAARRLRMSVAGTGTIDARQITAREADVSVAGSGDVRARVDGPASVSLMGSGDVELGGAARCTTSKMGSGTVRCG